MGNGAKHDAISDINQIKRMLLDGEVNLMFVLKELIQNADDSGARWMTLGYSTGIKDAQHPILRDPALYVVNEDGFRPQDAEAIRFIGRSAKATEAGTVGKFGLGLKTVFYLSELFFYQASVASSLDPEARAGVFNLWDAESRSRIPQTEWDSLPFNPEDQRRMRNHLQSVQVEDGFTLWLPLRRAEHCQRGNKRHWIHFRGRQKNSTHCCCMTWPPTCLS